MILINKLKCNHILKYYPLIRHAITSRNDSSCCKCNYVTDKVAVVTGGADGIGLECVKELLRSGARGCVIGDISREKECMEALTCEFPHCKIAFKTCDVTSKEQFSELFKTALDKFCGVHILLNNAGILNDAEWEREIATNVTALVRGTYLGLELMSKHKGGQGGSIVNFSSIVGLQDFAASPVYAGTKHFVIGFDRSLGDCYHFKRTGVKIFTLCPGVTTTPMILNVEKYAHKELDEGMGKLLTDSLAALSPQGPEAVAKGLIKMLNKGENGSIWVSECNDLYEVKMPNRKSLRVPDCDCDDCN